MVRLLLINVFSTLNKGDAAIAQSQIAALREALPGCEIAVQSWHPESDAPNLLGCRVVGPFFDMVSEKHPEWSRLRQRLYILSLLVKTGLSARGLAFLDATLPSAQREAMAAFRDADAVISVGGNFLYAYEGKNANSFLKHCHQIQTAQMLGKPVVLLAQSLGPVEVPRHRTLLRRIVERARAVLVRESLSLEMLRGLGSRMDHVSLTPDTAFLLPPGDPAAAERRLAGWGLPSGSGPRIGMTVRDWEFPYAPDGGEKNGQYKRHVAEAIDRIVASLGAKVVLLPQCISPDQDDRLCMRDIAQLVQGQDSVVVVEDDLPAAELKAVCGQLDLFVGTRMHSNIFATAMATPTLAISYQPKTDGIMKMLELDAWRISIDEMTADNLAAGIERLWTERDALRAHLTRKMADLQTRARADLKAAVEQALAPRR